MADVVKLGDKVKDRVTGLTGIVVARTDWLNGCIRMVVQPQELKDGKPVETSCFDIEELVLVEADALSPKPVEKRTNGPMPSVNREGR
jgi:hypothetical protein